MKDVIVGEIRAIRHQIETDYGNDYRRYLTHVYDAQKKHADKLVRLSPKPLRKRKLA